MAENRPDPGPELTGTELQRWYWTKAELTDLARTLGVSTSGSKIELTDRLAATLDGLPLPASQMPRKHRSRQLAGPVSRDTVIPEGQRSSQVLRTFFETEIGSSFRFDRAMREFIANNAGATLGEAVDHWHATRGKEYEIEPQFELNRFTRRWYAENPGGTRQQLDEAWQRYRSLPRDAREDA